MQHLSGTSYTIVTSTLCKSAATHVSAVGLNWFALIRGNFEYFYEDAQTMSRTQFTFSKGASG
jgi:hypothetical protein